MERRTWLQACGVLTLGSLLLAPLVSRAATYYLSAGEDFTTVLGKMQAGDTLFLHGGTYNQRLFSGSLRIPSGTSWSNPVTIASAPGETAVLPGVDLNGYGSGTYQFIAFDRLTVEGSGVFFGGSGVHDIRMSNSEVKNVKQHGPACSLGGPDVCPGYSGVSVYGAANVEFRSMQVHDNGLNRLDHGFYVCGHNLVIRDSDIWNNSGYGIQVYDSSNPGCSSGTQLLNNRIHDNRGDGAITLNHGSGLAVVGNRIEHNSGGAIQAPCGSGATNIRIEGNTFAGNTGGDMELCDGSRGAGPSELAARPEASAPPPLPTPKNLRLLRLQ